MTLSIVDLKEEKLKCVLLYCRIVFMVRQIPPTQKVPLTGKPYS